MGAIQRAIAFHEAAHAVSALAVGLPVERAEIIRDKSNRRVGGLVKLGKYPPEMASRAYLEKLTVVLLAGAEGARPFTDYAATRLGARIDREDARRVAIVLYASVEDRRAHLRRARESARAIVENSWLSICVLATALECQGILAGADIIHILEGVPNENS